MLARPVLRVLRTSDLEDRPTRGGEVVGSDDGVVELLSHSGSAGPVGSDIGHSGGVDARANHDRGWISVEVETHGFWLGGYQPPDSGEPDVDWQWVTGEPWTYTNWCSEATDEPNNLEEPPVYPDEDWLEIYAEPRATYWGKWNDLHKNRPFVAGYVVEHATAPTVVPAPTAALLAAIGLAMVAWVRRRAVA